MLNNKNKTKNRINKLSQKTAKAANKKSEYHANVSKKAYELFEKRGCQCGHDQNDWFKAEKLCGTS